MFVEYIIPKPMTESRSIVNKTSSSAIPRSCLSIMGFLIVQSFAMSCHQQLIAVPVVACEQLFSFTVETNVVSGF